MSARSGPAPAAAYAVAVALLCLMDALIKHLSATLPTVQIVWLRYFFAALVLLPALVASGRMAIGSRAFLLSGVRTVVMLVTAVLFMVALARLPLADAVAISFTSPFFMVLLGRLMLGEPIPPRAIAAVATGFAGVLVVAWGGFAGSGDLVGYACASAAALTYAAFHTMTRRDSVATPVLTLVGAQSLIGALLATPAAALAGAFPDGRTLGLGLVMGTLGAVGHLLIAWAFANAPSTRIAPIEFTALVWAALFGALWFGDGPAPATLAGGLLIIAGCLIVLRPAAAAPPP